MCAPFLSALSYSADILISKLKYSDQRFRCIPSYKLELSGSPRRPTARRRREPAHSLRPSCYSTEPVLPAAMIRWRHQRGRPAPASFSARLGLFLPAGEGSPTTGEACREAEGVSNNREDFPGCGEGFRVAEAQLLPRAAGRPTLTT